MQFNPRRDESILAESNCKSGKRVILCGLIRQSENDFLNTCDKMINNNPVTTNDVSQFFNTSMLWFTQSTDQYQVPIIVDLPVNLKINTDSPMVICKNRLDGQLRSDSKAHGSGSWLTDGLSSSSLHHIRGWSVRLRARLYR